MEYNSLYNKYNAEGERNILKNENWVGRGNADKREFYIAESVKNAWSSRQLESQIDSSLFEKISGKLLQVNRFGGLKVGIIFLYLFICLNCDLCDWYD
jgi:hypothetical protein